ncbi:unnamed protein product [Linum trigynum]|uniref:Uncharacterized protein n=1 Tax=Linum trigynum TaxID=586398 RepID=A0AAV2D1C6_9ROSI
MMMMNQEADSDVSEMTAEPAFQHYASMAAKSRNWSRRNALVTLKMVQDPYDFLARAKQVVVVAKEVQALNMSRNTLVAQLFLCE